MSNDLRKLAYGAAQALRGYAYRIENAHWDQPEPVDPIWVKVELGIWGAQEMAKVLRIIARFLESMFEEGDAA